MIVGRINCDQLLGKIAFRKWHIIVPWAAAREYLVVDILIIVSDRGLGICVIAIAGVNNQLRQTQRCW